MLILSAFFVYLCTDIYGMIRTNDEVSNMFSKLKSWNKHIYTQNSFLNSLRKYFVKNGYLTEIQGTYLATEYSLAKKQYEPTV